MATVVDSFLAATSDATRTLVANAAAMNNSAVFASPSGDPTAQVLATASYLPALSANTKPRGGTTPTYVVISRSAAPGGTGSASSVLTSIAANTAIDNVPHLFITYSGTAIQFIDLKNATTFLKVDVAPPGGFSTDETSDQILDSVIALTVNNEGTQGYDSWSLAGVPGTIAWGFIQFDQPRGSFPKLMKMMNAKSPDIFIQIFGADLAAILLDDKQVRNYPLTSFRDKFTAASQVPDFQAAQRELAKETYWANAVNTAQILGVYTQRAYAIYFDGAVQRGPAFMLAAAQIASKEDGDTAKLSKLAYLADFMNSSFSGPALNVPHKRRTALLNNPSLKDVNLQEAGQVGAAASNVSDASSVIVMFEGPVDGPITQAQLDIAAKVVRALTDVYTIPIAANRIFGADRLPDYKATNPGKAFNYLDFYSSVRTQPEVTVAFKSADELKNEKLDKNVEQVCLNLAFTPSLQGLFNQKITQSVAGLAAYDAVKSFQRASSVRQTRPQAVASAVAQNAQQQKGVASQSADVVNTNTALAAVQKVDKNAVKGLLFNFTTGVWSDGKPVGKIS